MQGPFWGWPDSTVTAVAFQEGNGSCPSGSGNSPSLPAPPRENPFLERNPGLALPSLQLCQHRYLHVGEPLSAQPHAKGDPLCSLTQGLSIHFSAMPLHSSILPVSFHPSSSHSVHRWELSAPLSFFVQGIPYGLNPSPTPTCIGREEGVKHSPSLGPNLLPLQSLQRRLTHITLERWLGEVFLPHSLIPHSVLKLPAQGKLHPALLLPSPCTLQGPSPMGTSLLPARACCQLPLHPAKECLVSPEQGSGGQPRK